MVSLIVIGMLLALACIYLLLRRLILSRMQSQALIKEFRQEVEKLIADFNQITDRNVAIFEERARALQALINQADQRLRLLQRTEKSEQRREERYRELGAQQKQLRALDTERHHRRQDKQAQIRELARQGYSHSEISLRVGVSIAEIEALLSFPE